VGKSSARLNDDAGALVGGVEKASTPLITASNPSATTLICLVMVSGSKLPEDKTLIDPLLPV
jgi:hypothetical protein